MQIQSSAVEFQEPAQETITLKGMVSYVKFHNNENGYTVIDFKPEGESSKLVVVGYSQSALEGDCLECTGVYQTTQKRGMQFVAESMCRALPDTEENMLTYLSSGMVKGIGASTAKRLIKLFGTDLVHVLDHDPECIRKLPRIGEKTYKKIITSWKAQREVMSVVHELYALGLPTGVAVRIHKKYKERALHVVMTNPYQLITDIPGLDFEFVDQIGKNVGIPSDSQYRIHAGMYAVLYKDSKNGHTYMVEKEFIRNCTRLLHVPSEKVNSCLDNAVLSCKVATGSLLSLGFDVDESFVALPHLHDAELDIVRHIKRIGLTKTSLAKDERKLIDHIRAEEKELKKKLGKEKFDGLSTEQFDAVLNTLKNKISIITGGPGVGKTTVAKIITGVLRRMNRDTKLATPTGRSAKKLSESTGMDAFTIHRTLIWDPDSGVFVHNEENKLSVQFIDLDEVSMMSVELMSDLLQAVPDHSSICFMGDKDQLMSIGAGSVFRDFIESGCILTSSLNHVYRQAQDSYIIKNARLVNSGKFPSAMPENKMESDFFLFQIDDAKRINDTVLDVVMNKLPKQFGIKHKEIQVISPTNKKTNGVFNLNNKLQDLLNPKSGINFPPQWKRPFRIGDKIIQCTNNSDLDVYNGDIGRVKTINATDDSMVVDFDGVDVQYTSDDMVDLMLAYAITVHKSQGSEYPVVVIVLDNQTPIMLKRNLLYTAMTRGKGMVVVIGSTKAIKAAVANDDDGNRRTVLRPLLMMKMSQVSTKREVSPRVPVAHPKLMKNPVTR